MTTGVASRNPYVGPQPFERKDAALFFGREAEVRELLSHVMASRVVLLYAPSGAGKTSLLNAGVIPLLEQEEQFEVLPPARVRGFGGEEMLRTKISNVYIYNALCSWVKDRATKRDPALAVASERGRNRPRPKNNVPVSPGGTLAEFLEKRSRRRDQRQRPLPRGLVFDQFEELFTTYPEQWEHREDFFRQLALALRADPYLRVVLALREDYLAELLAHVDTRPPLIPEPVRFRLERLGRTAAIAAVTRPLERTGRTFARDVAEQLVDDLLTSRVGVDGEKLFEFRGEFVEPVQLQLACHSLWAGLSGEAREITEHDLRKFGDVDQVLSRFYSEAVRAAAEEAGIAETLVRVWIDQNFITKTETRGMVLRERHTTAGIPNAVIDALEVKRLIRREPRAGNDWYELTHDRLIKPIRASNRDLQARSLGWEKAHELSRRANQALARAEEALLEARYDEALDGTAQALDIYREMGDERGIASALVRMADVAYAMEDFENALAHADQASDLAERVHDTLVTADAARVSGYALYALARFEDAVAAEERAVELYDLAGDQTSAVAMLLDFAWLHQEDEDYGAAVRACTRALKLSPDDLEVLARRGGANWYGAAYSAAVADFTRVLDARPGSPDVLSERGQALAEWGQFTRAVDDLERAIVRGTGSVVAYALSGLGLALGGLGEFDRALERFEDSLKRQPGNAWAYFNRALTYDRMQNEKEARAGYRRALEENDPPLNRWRREHADARTG